MTSLDEQTEKSSVEDELFFSVSVIKLSLLYYGTFGFYIYYWFFKNWKAAKYKSGLSYSAGFRAFFYHINAYFLYRRIKNECENNNVPFLLPPIFLALVYFIIGSLPNIKPLFSLAIGSYILSFFPFLYVNQKIAKLNKVLKHDYKQNSRFSFLNYFFITICFPALLFGLYSIAPVNLSYVEAGELKLNGKYDEAIVKYQKAINLAEGSIIFKNKEAEIRHDYAYLLINLPKASTEDFIEARKELKLVLALKESRPKSNISAGVAQANLAYSYRRQAEEENYDEKLYYSLLEDAYYHGELSVDTLLKEESWLNLAYSYFGLSVTSYYYGDLDRAIYWIKQAILVDEEHVFIDNLIEDRKFLKKLEAELESFNK